MRVCQRTARAASLAILATSDTLIIIDSLERQIIVFNTESTENIGTDHDGNAVGGGNDDDDDDEEKYRKMRNKKNKGRKTSAAVATTEGRNYEPKCQLSGKT